ncbi:MAG: UDP-N-acetylmuramoyl-L-alanyl-D-glutamate--2,6-diaminopimelate ligase, partial [Erysipelotrichaceae bacterium]|nr:UDP-N-acetylmuramoyl-L-alanyl-D-glutamate--2,6-diaminopimelate ligase [Erysipelotrichaceae bacterium]
MRLSDLFEGAPKTEIQSIMTDSRVKSERAVFFCIRGAVSDGHRFISQAKENGAIAIVHSEDLAEKDPGLVYIRVENVLETLNLVSVRFFGNC